MTSTICVIIPAYNAASTIKGVVSQALKHIPMVIVADDGSTDDTAKIATEAGAQVIIIDQNKGKGNALKTLFKKASDMGYDAFISLDADAQHDPDEIPLFINANAQYPDDLIVGSRMHEHDKIPRARFNSMYIARFFVCFAANQFIEDTQCGFRLYPRSLIEKICLTSERYATETEALIKTGDMGFTVRHVKIRAIYEDNGSHFKAVKDVGAITAYVVSYFPLKWFIEGITSDKPYTYSKNNLRDLIGRNEITNIIYQTFTALLIIPLMWFYLIEFHLFSLFIKNNFASYRKISQKFYILTLATQMLPLLVFITATDKLLNALGINLKLPDRFIDTFYPHMWG